MYFCRVRRMFLGIYMGEYFLLYQEKCNVPLLTFNCWLFVFFVDELDLI